jgi:hypothetical protein
MINLFHGRTVCCIVEVAWKYLVFKVCNCNYASMFIRKGLLMVVYYLSLKRLRSFAGKNKGQVWITEVTFSEVCGIYAYRIARKKIFIHRFCFALNVS